MNKTIISTLALLTGMYFSMVNNAWSQTTEAEHAAINVVNKYFTALQQGDVNTIKNVLTGKILQQTEAFLDQPGYANQLVNKFSASSLNINEAKSISSTIVIVNTTIQINSEEELKVSYKVENKSPTGIALISTESDW